jgi:hypothetical protein
MNELNNKSINEKKHYKAIILVIASYDDIYFNIINTWKKYIHKFDNVKIYLLHCRNDLEEQLYVDDEEGTIFYNCEESLIPGIFLKTIYAMEFCNKNYSYDYLIRTNLSSFYNIPNLITFLDCQKKENYAGGIHGVSYDIPFICGAGIVISNDVVKKMTKSALEEKAIETIFYLPDDIILSYLINLHIDPTTYKTIPRIDICERLTKEKMDLLSKEYFHFRNRNDENKRILDSHNIEFLCNYFYDN